MSLHGKVLNQLDILDHKVQNCGDATPKERSSTGVAINRAKTAVGATPEDDDNANDFLENFLTFLSTANDNFSNFTSGDPVQIMQGVINIVGTVAVVLGGPYGELVDAACGLVSAVLSLFGGGGSAFTKDLDAVIRKAMDDFQNENIYDEVIGSLMEINVLISNLMGVAQNGNGGLVAEDEKGILLDTTYSTVGVDTLGKLQGELDQYKGKNDDETKSESLPFYAFYYAEICYYKIVLSSIQLGLCQLNNMQTTYSAVHNYLYTELPQEGKDTLGFMSKLPDPDGCYYWMMYRYLHLSLSLDQRTLLTNYRQLLGLDPMPGRLVCLLNKDHNGYMYHGKYKVTYHASLRYALWWDPGTADKESIYNFIDAGSDNVHIYNVYWGEYVFGSDTHTGFNVRGVYSDTSGKLPDENATWKVSEYSDGYEIRNTGFNDLMYGSHLHFSLDKKRRYVYLWKTESYHGDDATWYIRDCGYTTTEDFNAPAPKA